MVDDLTPTAENPDYRTHDSAREDAAMALSEAGRLSHWSFVQYLHDGSNNTDFYLKRAAGCLEKSSELLQAVNKSLGFSEVPSEVPA